VPIAVLERNPEVHRKKLLVVSKVAFEGFERTFRGPVGSVNPKIVA
jgi:hypothetical protein